MPLAPFVAGPPIMHPRQFFGREGELRRIFGVLGRFPLQHIAIIGLQRSGKTSLLRYLRHITKTPPEQLRPGQQSDWLKQPDRYRWVFVDFQDPTDVQPGAACCPTCWPSSACQCPPVYAERLYGCGQPRPARTDGDPARRDRHALEAPELDLKFWWGLRSLCTNPDLRSAGSHPDIPAATGAASPRLRRSHRHFSIFSIGWIWGRSAEPAARELIASSAAAVRRC